jgi:3-isopropylmalate/(R)-2-methylmalate dehydratase small subunit
VSARRISGVDGRAIPLRGHDVDTDRIIPARFLRAVTFEGLEAHVFEDDRASWPDHQGRHAFDDPRFAGAAILVVNRNFGCGSSREHAPQALQRWGIAAIVGESFSEIFFGNALALGLPCVSVDAGVASWLQELVEREPGTRLRVDLDVLSVSAAGRSAPVALPAPARDALITGGWDATGLLLEDYEQVRARAAQLPYLRGFPEKTAS